MYYKVFFYNIYNQYCNCIEIAVYGIHIFLLQNVRVKFVFNNCINIYIFCGLAISQRVVTVYDLCHFTLHTTIKPLISFYLDYIL